jgi:hypothetical protein
MKKLSRKQPRRLTPPLVLRCDDGERQIIEVDTEVFILQASRSSRTTAILELAPGLKIRVGSRCLNKHRVTVLRIEPAIG